MNDKPLQTEVGALCNELETVGLKTTARLVFVVLGDRSLQDHERRDQTRQPLKAKVQDSLASGVHTTPGKEGELTPDEVRAVRDQPPEGVGAIRGDDDERELKALEAAGAIRLEGRHIFVSDPITFATGVVSLLVDEHIWRNQAKHEGKSGFFEAIIKPVRTRLLTLGGCDLWLWLLCQASRFYGVRVRTIPVKDVYMTAPSFVKNAGLGTAMTLSTSSGILDPLERAGTDALLDELHIPPGTKAATTFQKKHWWDALGSHLNILHLAPPAEAREHSPHGNTAAERAGDDGCK